MDRRLMMISMRDAPFPGYETTILSPGMYLVVHGDMPRLIISDVTQSPPKNEKKNEKDIAIVISIVCQIIATYACIPRCGTGHH